MLTTTFSDLRNNARKYFDAVEAGETVEVYRHGKPVAVLSPYNPAATRRWQQSQPHEHAQSHGLRVPEQSLAGHFAATSSVTEHPPRHLAACARRTAAASAARSRRLASSRSASVR